MSAPPIVPSASTSASGYEDGFGRRVLAFDREEGAILERLYLRPEFSIYEPALRDAFGRLAANANAHIVAPHALERDHATGELVAVSRFASGERLSDLLDAALDHARGEGVVPGIEVALGFLLDVLPTIETMRTATALSHGAVAPSRCVLTSDGRVVLTECGFADVLQRLNLNRQRLWREFRVAVPPVAGSVRFDATGDISQAAVLAVMLILGRPMTDDDAADVLPELMAEAIEIAQIRSNVSFAINLQRFLQRALPLPGRRPYQTVDAALHDVRQLASGIGVALCQSSLADFVRGTSSTPAAAGAVMAEEDIDDIVIELESAAPLARLTDAPAAIEITLDLSAADDVEWPAPDAATPTPVDTFEWPIIEPIAATPTEVVRPPIEEPLAPTAPAVVEKSQPEPVHESRSARRRRSRAKRTDDDTLRSFAVVPTAPEPPPPAAVAPPVEPVPITIATVPVPDPVRIFVAPPITLAPAPVAPQPVFVPLRSATETLWESPKAVVPHTPVTAAPRLVPAAVTPPTRLRLKNDLPPGFTPKSSRYEPREFSAAHLDPRSTGEKGARRKSWAFAAAAAVAMIAIAAAARNYLPDTDSLKAQAKGAAAPVTVAAPPPVTTGTIVVQTQPAGARVLLDGSPAGETPLRIVDVAPGRHVLTFVTATATVKRTVKVEADKTLTLDVPVFSGWVAVFAPIVLEISEEGRALGTTENGRLMLPPGRHTLTLTNRDFGYSASHAVDVEAGEVKSLNIQPAGTVNLNAVPWAEIWIDGKKAGDTPLANLELPLGNREIIFRHPELGERRMMAKVTAGAPTAVSVDFSK